MTLKANELKVGDSYQEEICNNLSRTQIVMYAGTSGDYNPLHSDPESARRSGFDRPILHGLATFGIACRALMLRLCGNDPDRVAGQDGRFSSPVFPGEEIAVDMWHEETGVASYVARVPSRDVVVLTNGRFEYRVR